MARPRLHDEELRLRLIDRAARTVASDGIGALSLRNLAAAEKTSTTAIYSLFGGRSELIGAVFDRATVSFAESQDAAETTADPLADLLALAHAYRDWAEANPHLFGVIFGGLLTGFTPTEEQLTACFAAMGPLTDAVRRGLAAGVLEGHADAIALACWAAVHGLVTLAMGGPALQVGDGAFDQLMRATLRGWAPRAGA